MIFKLSSAETKARLDLPFEAPLGVEIRPIKPKRSHPQNDFLWPLLRELGAHVGFTAEELYDELACEVFGYELRTYRGTERKRPNKRPSKATRDEFSQIIETALRWAAEEGITWDE